MPTAGPGRVTTRAVELVGTAVLVVMTLHIVVNALARTVGDSPVPSTIEVVSFWYMPAVAFLGMVVAQVHRSHTEARIVVDRLPAAVRREVHVVGQLLAAALSALLAWYGLTEARHNQEIGLTGGVTGLVIWPTTFLVPACFAVLAVLFVLAAFTGPDGAGDPDPEEGHERG